ncbi:LacI family DNA-binding transcriptional regulator [Lentilactobacillus kisonensis]|uniref:Sugar-binding domain protein n=2 Tax=Lentilactobacillus kisonensis TaxID=481722 RepID=H1LE18_9LACO|nr:LacI family DNA-binding transcriptional regulator [Lentilactobacillus kisonensis]EHO52808.1 sugar-binding domain protein [Lentilactobacillus kisonensis F0435]KRL22535.1 sugar-binding domain protein [Lentilactobacillus kisonensis DSM 19906 = JCM 15041]
MTATIKDIARKIGVAPSTVSRVLSNKPGVGPAMTAKIQKVAKELGYQKNRAAVELVKQRSNVIAAVVSSVKTSFAGQIIEGIQTEAEKNGLNLIIVYSHSADPIEQRKALSTVIERPLRGILLLSIALSSDNLVLLQNSQIPFCFLSISLDKKTVPFISSNDWQIGYQSTQFLLKKGHQHIGLAAIDKYPYTGRLRLAGYQQALKEADITPRDSWVQLGDYSYAAGKAAMLHYGADTDLTAVIAGSDAAGVGVLNQARILGLKVPSDLSILSIDGTDICEMVQPQLTSISQDFYSMGIEGVKYLQLLGGQSAKPMIEQKYTATQIVERESICDLGKSR